MYRQSGKNLLSSNISSTCEHNMVNFGPLAAEIVSLVWGTPGNFNGFRVFGSVTARHLVVGVSQTAALNRGRHLFSTGRPSRWAFAHISTWQKCYRESKKSDDVLFSHLTYLVLLHYLAKWETQKTSHWCIVHATQSNFCSALDLVYPELRPPKSPELNALITRFRESYNSLSMSHESKRLKKSSSRLNSGNALIQHLSEKCDFRVSRCTW